MKRAPRITAAMVAWELTDKEIVEYAFDLLRKRFDGTMGLIVSNRLNDVQEAITLHKPDRKSFD